MAKPRVKKTLTRAERAIKFVETYCKIPEGMFVGQPLVLDKFQRDFYYALFDGNRRIRRAIWSMARKNAKTVTIATLLLVFLVGPEARQNSQVVSGAMSREQAALVFNACTKMINMSPELSGLIKIIPSHKTLIGLPMNVEYKALSAEGKYAHGLSPLVVIVDELGQVVGPRSEFFSALETSQGAHNEPLMVVISTQAANDGDLLSILIDDALAQQDDPDSTSICHLFTAPPGCDLMDESAWYAANPALGKFRSLEDVRQLAENAVRMPSSEPSFRNLILNQRVSTNSPFVSRTTWMESRGEPVRPEDCEELYGGLDLSGRTDLTAFVLIGLHKGIWHVFVTFWTPEKGLHDRAHRDRAPYDTWVQQGFMQTTPGATVDYEFVVTEIGRICAGLNITAIGFDRWRIDILKKEMERAGLELPLVEWGQGFKDMAPALDALEGHLLNSSMRHGGHPVLTMCAANAMVIKDPAGNRKLDKMKTSGRIDGMQALAIAAGVADRMHDMQGNINDFLAAPLVL
jgi:phage terminase large subunit-like protein